MKNAHILQRAATQLDKSAKDLMYVRCADADAERLQVEQLRELRQQLFDVSKKLRSLADCFLQESECR